MTRPRIRTSLDSIQALWTAGSLTGLSDRELLDRFRASRQPFAELAFEALVRRHGPMVLRVCRQILWDGHAAEDAFQSTFLVLARKPGSVRHPERLSRWLYGVAMRAARKARSIQGRETERARPIPPAELEKAVGDDKPLDARLIQREAIDLLHEELGRLPVKYSLPVILCHLEGLTHEEAARRLKWPVGTVSVRLMRGRVLLRHRLIRRGLTPAFAMPAAILAQQANAARVPAALIEATIRSVMQATLGPGTMAPTAAVTLSEAVLRSLGVARICAVASLFAAVVLGVAAGVAGARWLSPEDDLDARALAFATRLAAVTRPVASTPAPRLAPTRILDRKPPPDSGYDWVAFAHGLRPGSILWHDDWTNRIIASGGLDCEFRLHQCDDGDLLVTVTHPFERQAERILDYRPVVFDNQGGRCSVPFDRSSRCTSEAGDRTAVDRFRLRRDILSLDRLQSVGIERMTREEFERVAWLADKNPQLGSGAPPDPISANAVHPSSGCSWVLGPYTLGRGDWAASASGPRGGVVCALSRTSSGVLNIDIAYRSRTPVSSLGGCVEEYRPVVVERSGRRHVLLDRRRRLNFGPVNPGIYWHCDANGPVETAVYLFQIGAASGPIPFRFAISPSDVALIGVERLSPETLRDERAAAFITLIDTNKSFEMRDRLWRGGLPLHALYFHPLPAECSFALPWGIPWLGAYEILRDHLGRPSTTPESLRSARIAEFVAEMKRDETARGDRFSNWVDPALAYAYELVRNQPDQWVTRSHAK